MLLWLKLVLVPALVGGVTLAVGRWGLRVERSCIECGSAGWESRVLRSQDRWNSHRVSGCDGRHRRVHPGPAWARAGGRILSRTDSRAAQLRAFLFGAQHRTGPARIAAASKRCLGAVRSIGIPGGPSVVDVQQVADKTSNLKLEGRSRKEGRCSVLS